MNIRIHNKRCIDQRIFVACSEKTLCLEVHQALVLRPSYFPEKVGLNKKRCKSEIIFLQEIMEFVGVSVIERRQPTDGKPKIRGCKLRSGVYWQWALKQKDVKQGLRVVTW